MEGMFAWKCHNHTFIWILRFQFKLLFAYRTVFLEKRRYVGVVKHKWKAFWVFAYMTLSEHLYLARLLSLL